MKKTLAGDYIAGFVDGEGCFALKYRRDRQKSKLTGKFREYFYWRAEFAIVLHPSDANLLELIKKTLGVGHISYKKSGDQARFSVQDINDLNEIIVPFFRKHHLMGIKGRDFRVWSEAVGLIFKHQIQSRPGLSRAMDDSAERKLGALKSQADRIKSRVDY